MRRRQQDRFALEERLHRYAEINAAVSWPTPIHHRLDQLVEVLEDSGDRTTRKELAAALIFAAPVSGKELSNLLRRYRKARVRDALLKAPKGENVVELARQGPGPRRRRAPG